MYNLLFYNNRLFIHNFKFTKRLLSQKLSPKHIQQINDKEIENRKYPESVAIVLAPTVISTTTTTAAAVDAVAAAASSAASTIIIKRDSLISTDNKRQNKLVKSEEFLWNITPSQDKTKIWKHYLMLSKFRLTSLVVITTMAGYAMAPAPFELTTFILCSVGTGLCSAAANAINQYHEVPFDSQMSRTKNRVLVRGLVTPLHAIGFAAGASLTGLSMLYFGVNGLTATLGAGNLILYTSIYTPMKRFSVLNTWVGSIVGAVPPVMGWVGCSGTIDMGAWILAGLLYAWQFPHFNALSWNLRPDYSRAGYRMMAVTNPGLCRRTALRYTGIITGLSLVAPFYGVTNIWFALETLPLNIYFGYLAWKFYKHSDSGTSRKLFRFSLIHLPLLMILFLLNKKRWIFTETSIESSITEAAGAAVTSTTIATSNNLISNSDTSISNSNSDSKISNLRINPINEL